MGKKSNSKINEYALERLFHSNIAPRDFSLTLISFTYVFPLTLMSGTVCRKSTSVLLVAYWLKYMRTITQDLCILFSCLMHLSACTSNLEMLLDS